MTGVTDQLSEVKGWTGCTVIAAEPGDGPLKQHSVIWDHALNVFGFRTKTTVLLMGHFEKTTSN